MSSLDTLAIQPRAPEADGNRMTRWIAPRLRRIAREETGMSLMELMMCTAMLAVVLGATLSLMETGASIAPKDAERALVIRESQTGLARMTRELRAATSVNAMGDAFVDFNIAKAADDYRIYYDCDATGPDNRYKACRRYQATIVTYGVTPALPGTGEILVERVIDGQKVFAPNKLQAPTYVGVRLKIPAGGARKQGYTHNVTLDDGVYVRNHDLRG